MVYLYGAIAFVILAMITNASMGLGERNEGMDKLFIFLVLVVILAKIVKSNLNKGSKPNAAAVEGLAKENSRPKSSTSNPTIDNAARRIRQLASDFEDKSVEILFTLDGMQVERTTQSRTTVGDGKFRITKTGFKVVYRNRNSNAQKPHYIEKRWDQIAGCLPDDYELFFGDNTALRVIPRSNIEDYIFFTVAWQALNSPMNGGWKLFREPETTNIGNRLRQVADYIQANGASILQKKGSVVLEEIEIEPEKTDIKPVKQKSAAPTTGDKIGKWVLGEKLGGPSGQGAVYQAKFEGKGETFAIKILQWAGKNPENNTQFHAQAKSLMDEAKLSMNYSYSPFILGAVHFGLEPWPWVRYPLIQGKTLAAKVRAEGVLGGEDWWNLAHDLLSGLALVHKDGLIHRDIKSDNLMFVDNHYVILDFGLSEVAGYLGQGPNGGHTSGFAAPELLAALAISDYKALEKLTPALDVYSAGVLLYFARTGRLPWDRSPGSPETELTTRLTTDADFSEFNEIELGFLEGMFAIEPSERPTSLELLETASKFVDLEEKTILIEEGQLAHTLRIGEPDFDPSTEIGDEYEVKGPFKSWKEFREVIRDIAEHKKPRYFVIEFELAASNESTYVQAMKENFGWHAECMSERFSEVEHSEKRKTIFAKLGWTPPTGDSPNYIMPIDQDGWETLSNELVDALEQGFGISPSSISSFFVTLQGLGYYK